MPATALERVKWFVFNNFERVLVLVLVASLLAIHWLVDYKIAFLSFYYLPIMIAGFYAGRQMAVWSASLIVTLVGFFQAVEGLDGDAGFPLEVLLTLIPWGGFLILTGFIIGRLSEQRLVQMDELKRAYMTMLELLTFHLEATQRQQQGHSHRVATLAAQLARELGSPSGEIENVRVAALLHEAGPNDPRLLKLLAQFPGEDKSLPLASAVRGATDLLQEYARYYESVGDEWPIDHLGLSTGVRVLAVADAFETLQMPTPYRPAFARWTALEEIERGVGRTFAGDAVKALRKLVATPERTERDRASA